MDTARDIKFPVRAPLGKLLSRDGVGINVTPLRDGGVILTWWMFNCRSDLNILEGIFTTFVPI